MTRLDESSIIKIFQAKLGKKGKVSEDVETCSLGGTKIVAKTDTLVESTDIPPKMTLADAARKSVVACISDFAAKGVKPRYGMISVNLPKTIPRLKVSEIATGFKNACKEYDISILGGDTNEGKEIVFNVCVFGMADKKIVTRRGSKKGDLIFVTGPFGYTAAGLHVLLAGKKITGKSFAKRAVASVLKPKPRMNFGLKSGRYFSSSMDSSDGLSTTLNEMSRQGKKKFVVTEVPCLTDVKDFAESQKLNLDDLVFHGGEEYEFVFTASPKHKRIIEKNAVALKTPVMEIGYVAIGEGVFVQKQGNGRMIRLRDLGWKHFR